MKSFPVREHREHPRSPFDRGALWEFFLDVPAHPKYFVIGAALKMADYQIGALTTAQGSRLGRALGAYSFWSSHVLFVCCSKKERAKLFCAIAI